MTFYQELSRRYDEIFPASHEEMSFIRQKIADCWRLLDIGCGTGNKTELLAAPGRSITGIDSDEEMIRQARANHAGPGLEYLHTDMKDISQTFPAGCFDGLICLGNTLPHLTKAGELEKFIKDLALIAAPGARLIVQILNYDYINQRSVTELPLIETEHTIFRRFYDRPGPELRFRTRLEIKGGPSYDHNIPLKPILKGDLEKLLSPCFQNLEFYGGYDGRSWQADSLVCLLSARVKLRAQPAN